MVKLNIAFFGSDRFSILSMKRLLQLQQDKPDLINSIELVARRPKMYKKQLTDVPILSAFPGVKLHRADNKKQLLKLRENCSFNLVVAVSYGKLVPSELIDSMKYGGLNVHPSSLPKYSGSSPIQFALINDDKETGVSVQTLHPTKFDLGDILLQQNQIPIEDTDNYDSLVEKLGTIGGDALAKCIEEKLFVDPLPITSQFEFSNAHKLVTPDKQIFWETNTARQVYKRFCALGSLFTFQYCAVHSRLQKRNRTYLRRVILDDIRVDDANDLSLAPGEYRLDGEERLRIGASGNSSVSVGKLLMETFKQENPKQFMTCLKKRIGTSEAKFVDLKKDEFLKI